MMRLFLLVPALIFACAFTQPQEKLADPALEARAMEIGRNLRCIVCEGQSVEDSNAPQAHDVRVLVREMVAQGKTDADVLEYMKQRYGNAILMTPPFDAATLILWLAPLLVLAGAGLAAWFNFKRRARRF